MGEDPQVSGQMSQQNSGLGLSLEPYPVAPCREECMPFHQIRRFFFLFFFSGGSDLLPNSLNSTVIPRYVRAKTLYLYRICDTVHCVLPRPRN